MTSFVKYLKITTLAAVLTIPSGMVTAEEPRNFSARGLGALACSDLVGLIAGPERELTSELIVAWLAGYISHANRTTPDIYDTVPVENLYGVATILARICEGNQEALVEPVANRILNTFQPLAMVEVEELQEVSNDTTSIRIAGSVMQHVQTRLIERGLLSEGSADGQFGPMTRGALTEFQEGLGMSPTGIPDPITVYLLETSS